MKTNIKFGYVMAIVAIALFTVSCSTKQGKESDAHEHSENMEEDHQAEEAEEGGHEHGGAETSESEGKVWNPSGTGPELLQSDFHYITGATDNINPVVVEVDGASILKLTADGTTTAFVFHSSYGNVGLAAVINRAGFEGTVKVIHHARSVDNYEFVAVNGNNMKLGRVADGKESIFDDSSFSSDGDWLNLRASAAGSHFKGYNGNKMVTHGHGDEMEKGYVGIMLEGTGTVQIKSIEVTVLEDE